MEEHTAALAAEAQSSCLRQSTSSAIKPQDTVKRVQNNLQQDRLAHSKLAQQFGPRPSLSTTAKSVPRVHNFALKIPWV